jgi:hypothetical protein
MEQKERPFDLVNKERQSLTLRLHYAAYKMIPVIGATVLHMPLQYLRHLTLARVAGEWDRIVADRKWQPQKDL